MPRCVALIPARCGSKRLPNKNIRPLNGHPLMAYTIAAARQSGVFDGVVVSTDSEQYAEIARRYWATALMRPAEFATDTSPDIEWVRHALEHLKGMLWSIDCFCILRPTNPFRTVDTIRRAWARWCEKGERFDSMRAVELCSQHPYKMWLCPGSTSAMEPVVGLFEEHVYRRRLFEGEQGHSRQYAELPRFYVQNASLEIAWTKTVFEKGSIAGDRVLPFFTEGHEGMDVNRPQDWDAVELILSKQEASLPQIEKRWPQRPYMDSDHDPWWHYRDKDGNLVHLDKAGTWQGSDTAYLHTDGTDDIRARTLGKA